MNTSTLSELKKELKTLKSSDLIELCLRMAKYKKENKELLSYLLFDSNGEREYIQSIKTEIDLHFQEINTAHSYYAKKSLRKIIKNINKYIRFSGQKQTEAEIRIHFCLKLKSSGIPIYSTNSFINLYHGQIRKIDKAVASLHEDLQYDFQKQIEELI